MFSCETEDGNEESYRVLEEEDGNGNTYKRVEGDPYGVRIYELENGLKVYLAKDEEEPRVQALTAVRAGSAVEQKETTGLAHYLEHMLFKGTDRIGTLDWDKEKSYLDSISDFYERRRNTEDPEERKALYERIDSLSQEAARYAVPNEFDKILSSMGADRVNAFTSKDMTVYLSNIPSNRLKHWVKLERERYRKMVLRLFHTELETVFEEFNRGQDSDFRRASEAMDEALFAGHNYAYSTIGKAEHLKNPSMENVHAFKDRYYAPNNMALCLSGDIDPARVFRIIKEEWGDMEPNEELDEEKDLGEVKALDSTVERTVQGPEAERVYVGYRFPREDTVQRYVELISELLSNGQAGLFDLNLVKKQKVLRASSYANFYNELGMLRFYGQAKKGQDLEEVKELMFEQLDKLKEGDFPEWMLEAVIRNEKKTRIRGASSKNRAYAFMDAFIKGDPWEKRVRHLDELEKVRKEDLVAFAKENLDSSRVIVYKRSGEDTDAVEVPKPPITNISINREQKSDYRKDFEEMGSDRIDPVFVDYDEAIGEMELSEEVPLKHTENEKNELFSLYFIVEMGKKHAPQLSLAIDYLEKLGTERYSPQEVAQEFYKLATSFSVRSGGDFSYVLVSGLPETLEESMKLMEHLVRNVEADDKVYEELVEDILEERRNDKKSKYYNFAALYNYGMYGEESDFTNELSEEELRAIDPEELVERIRELFDHDHLVYYYGQEDPEKVRDLLAEHHELKEDPTPIPEEQEFESRETKGDSVFFVDYDMVQSQVALVSRDGEQDRELLPYSRVYNKYYGRGLSSVVFQEIRESKGLAYSASASYSMPDTGEHHFSYGTLGTQSDKTHEAIGEMKKLLNEMPRAEGQFEDAKENILQNIETDRITGTSVFWNQRYIRRQGFEEDPRRMVYEAVQEMTLDDMEAFFKEHIQGGTYDLLIMTDRENISPADLERYGKVTEVDRDKLFGY